MEHRERPVTKKKLAEDIFDYELTRSFVLCEMFAKASYAMTTNEARRLGIYYNHLTRSYDFDSKSDTQKK